MQATSIVLPLTLLILTILIDSIFSNPILGLWDSNCFVVRDEKCPNQNVTFWLYKNETRQNPLQLLPENLNPWDFQPRRPVKILIHGYTGHRDFAPNAMIRPAFLDAEHVYVISVDYGPLVRQPCYFAGVENLPVASRCLAQLINNLVSLSIVDNDDLHVIGFSLGAQVAGQTANYLQKKLKRITGLDPAKPMFITVGSDRKLDPTDADFVDVIHTDVLGRGMLRSMGHADFYPNIGLYQPGCQEDNNPGSCNHERAPYYYAESIINSSEFWGFACPSWLHYIFGMCGNNTNDAVMGYHVNHSALGSFFLSTSHKSPFALGPIRSQLTGNVRLHSNSNFNMEQINYVNFEPQLTKGFPEFDAVVRNKIPKVDEANESHLN
ncbi:pancreatic triacylglycerol lipase [Teleopsis dalmanni]|uniref:pancreatic triacylglycerol lipase n=1 Tax=Teleopsis dalmanni TaxID=139649 RepID=UPI0018CE947D|nr:pancreatic triacylglycerol lipase [Teleopsis dalmanni]